jgi:hypothetical protein
VWLEGLGQLKYSMTSSGIEPATFRLIAYCLNQLRYYVPQKKNDLVKNTVNLNRAPFQEFLMVLQLRKKKRPWPQQCQRHSSLMRLVDYGRNSATSHETYDLLQRLQCSRKRMGVIIIVTEALAYSACL